MNLAFKCVPLKVFFLFCVVANFSHLPASAQNQSEIRPVAAAARNPVIAADAGTRLHVAYEYCAKNKKEPDIFYRVSNDHGLHWSQPHNVSNTPGASHHADIAVEKNGAVDIIWLDTGLDPRSPDVFFARSVDGGVTWTRPTNISCSPGISAEPALAVGPDNAIHAVWTDTSKGEKNQDIFYTVSKDGGEKWSAAEDISNTPGVSSSPAIACSSGGQAQVAWSDTTPGETKPDIFYIRQTQGGWSKALNISKSAGYSVAPCIAASSDKIFIAYSDNTKTQNTADIWLDVGNKEGKFKRIQNMSDSLGSATDPRAACDDKTLAIVWSDTTSGVKTPSIYGNVSNNYGKTFSPLINITNAQHAASHADVTVAGGKIYTIWQETMPANGSTSVKMRAMDPSK